MLPKDKVEKGLKVIVSETSYILGSRTPNYGSRTPSHDPSRTPSHDPARTPSHVGHGGAWDPTQPNTPARPSDEFDNYSFDGPGPSPVSQKFSISSQTLLLFQIILCGFLHCFLIQLILTSLAEHKHVPFLTSLFNLPLF